jgi:ABC-type transport system, involved in lipoprotein release, permease component
MKKQNILSIIVRKNIKSSKMKNILSICVIAAATCLLLSVFLYFMGREMQLSNEILERSQATFLQVEESQINLLKGFEEVERIGEYKEIGLITEQEYQLNVTYMDESVLKLSQLTKLEGILPKEPNEVMILDDFLKHINSDAKVGDEIVLKLRGKEEKFVISGILSVPSANNSFLTIVSEHWKSQTNSNFSSCYVRLANTGEMTKVDLQKKMYTLASQIGCEERNVIFSSYYFALAERGNTTEWIAMFGISVVVMFAIWLVIYSIFYMDVIRKTNEYGKLRILGASRKQIRDMIIKESSVLFLGAIPYGILGGCGIGYLLLPAAFQVRLYLYATVVVTLFIYMVVRMAVHKPAKIASGISPIEAIKYLGHQAEIVKKLRKKLRLSLWNLAKINLLRNRKKTILTILSLSFCGILLMSSASYLHSINPEELARKAEFPYGEFRIQFIGGVESYESQELRELQVENYFNLDFLEEITKLDGVKNVKKYSGFFVFATIENQVTETIMLDAISEWEYLSMGEHSSDEFTTESYGELQRKQGLIIRDIDWNSIFGYDIQKGSIVHVKTMNDIEMQLEIVGTVKDSYNYGGYDMFFIGNKQLSKLAEGHNTIYQVAIQVEADMVGEVKTKIEQYIEQYPQLEIKTLEESTRFYAKNLEEQTIPLYTIVLIIGFFGLINLINTLTMNVFVREKEFAMLQTLGLSNRQLSKLLLYEGGYYSVLAISLTFILGTGSGVILCEIFDTIGFFGRVMYQFPKREFVAYALIVALSQMIFSAISIKYYKKTTLVERIKNN